MSNFPLVSSVRIPVNSFHFQLQCANFQDVDDEDVSRLRTLDPDQTTEEFKIDMNNILKIAVVDWPMHLILALNAQHLPRVD